MRERDGDTISHFLPSFPSFSHVPQQQFPVCPSLSLSQQNMQGIQKAGDNVAVWAGVKGGGGREGGGWGRCVRG